MESSKQGSLPLSFTETNITLIAKKDKELAECSSHGPIFLLNTDARILAKTRTNKVESALPAIISKDQSCFIKGRQSFFNIRRLLNIIHTCSEDIPECILSVDAEKAFDRIEWLYLFSGLEHFGLGTMFMSWIKLLYSHPTASISTNSQNQRPFRLHQGTRYWAANQWCLIFWSYFHGKLDCPDCVSVKQHVNNTYSAFAFLGSPLPLSSISSIKVNQNPVDQHTWIWAEFRKCWGFQRFSLLSPITSNYLFKPASLDPGF